MNLFYLGKVYWPVYVIHLLMTGPFSTYGYDGGCDDGNTWEKDNINCRKGIPHELYDQ